MGGATMTDTRDPESQHMKALAKANKIRLAQAAIKREIRAGERDVRDVIADPGIAGSVKLTHVIEAQVRWGRARAERLLRGVEVNPHIRLEAMTRRQRGVVIAALDEKL